MRSWLLFIVLYIPAVAAQGPVSSITLTSETILDISEGEVVVASEEPSQNLANNPDECLSDGQLFSDPGKRSFRFREESWQAGCAAWQITTEIPIGVDSMELIFSSSRDIQKSLQTPQLSLESNQIQMVQFFNASSQIGRDAHYFGANEPPADPPLEKVIATDLEDDSPVTLSWYFQDASPSANTKPADGIVPGVGQSFGARIESPRILFPDRELPINEIEWISSHEVDGQIITYEGLPIDLDARQLRASVNQLAINLLATHTVTGLLGANATAHGIDELIITSSGGVQTVVVPDHLLSAPSRYVLQLKSSAPAPPPPLAPAPTLFMWLPISTIALVGVTVTSAGWHQARIRAIVAQTQRRSSTRNVLEILFVTAAFVALTAFVILHHLETMATLSLSPFAVILYGGFAILLLMALVHLSIGVLRRRYAVEMRHSQAIEEANQILARSNRDLEQFAYVASHDLQEPLRKVATFTGLLSKRYPDRLDATGQGYLENANEAALRARQLIRDLLSFSRIGRNEETGPVNLDSLLDSVVNDLETRITATATTITIGDMPVVTGSAPLLHQMFSNIISNAMKYVKPGVTPEISLFSRVSSREAIIAIQDNGIGIDEEFHEKVFQVFQRLHERSSEYRGNGIGLAICQRIAEFHGGRIWLHSKPGQGTTFYVALPLRE